MLIVFFLALIAGLIAAGGCLGFFLGIYVFRPSLLDRLAGLDGQVPATSEFNSVHLRVCVGLSLAGAMPVVGLLAYGISGSSWFAEFFGPLSEKLFIVVVGAFTVGVVLGVIMRDPGAADRGSGS